MELRTSTLGQTIRRRRLELNLTQEELADRIGGGVRQSEVSRLERDRITLPRRERLERIAAAIEMPIGELLKCSGWTGEWSDRQAAVVEPQVLVVTSPVKRQRPSVDLERLRSAIEQARINCEQTASLLERLSVGSNSRA
jgi:transcriptional regulator with XRE-family HTH domain